MHRTFLTLILLIGLAAPLQDATARKRKPRPKSGDTKTKVNIKKMERAYWKQRPTSELVQDRVFEKGGRFELGLLSGMTISDPFLSSPKLGLAVGYHFNEYFSFNLLGWKLFVKDSTAHEQLKSDADTSANTNEPSLYYAGEFAASLVYGKIALFREKIFYFDFHLLANGGFTRTETGTFPTYGGGIGQQIWLNRYFALRLDIRYHFYRETIKNKTTPKEPDDPALGVTLGDRSNTGFNYTLGLSLML